jgi:hypothetical protein
MTKALAKMMPTMTKTGCRIFCLNLLLIGSDSCYLVDHPHSENMDYFEALLQHINQPDIQTQGINEINIST